jgi:high-affinity Fe2+/Pb2+ permease
MKRMTKDKAGAMNMKSVEVWIIGFVLVTVLFEVIASLFPIVTDAGSSLNSSGFPLASFFLSTGAVWYLVAAGLVILVYRAFTKNSK